MNSTTTQDSWLLTADRRCARLLSMTHTLHGRRHVEEHAQHVEQWDDLQHGRPSARSGKDGHSYASRGHEDEERLHRFAKSTARWLEDEMGRRGIDHVNVFAAPRLLGELRQVLPKRLLARIETHSIDLAQLTPGDLADHDAVVDVERRRRTAASRPPNLTRAQALVRMAESREITKQLTAEHAQVRAGIEDLLEAVDRMRSEPQDQHAVDGLHRKLRDFAQHLRRHFELEESGGLMLELESMDSQQREAIARLLEQHRALDQRLTALVDSVERAHESQTALSDEFVQGLRELFRMIVQHENAENAVVEQAASRQSADA